jgi:UDP-N-acetylglucosamine--N-acetylmuramyl-(pentapeptide) pyrophosphoryl-undecaprenol N-acetylglucosamine transferase
LWISGLQRKLSLKNLVFPFKVLSSLLKSGKILNQFKPHAAVGVGGYASGPLMYMAHRKGIPTVIQEQNSFPGITNRLLARRADKFCVAYQGLDRFFPKDKIVITGNPIRKGIATSGKSREEAIRGCGFDPENPVALVLGGSLGARTINASIAAKLEEVMKAGVQLIWQTGKGYIDQYRHLESQHAGIKIQAFITDMASTYEAADVIVSRAGAISVSELCLVGKPVILVPSPNVAEDHQTKNAKALVDKGAAILVTDKEAPGQLVPALLDLIDDKEKQTQLSQNIKTLAKPNATADIVREVLALAEKQMNRA